GTMSHRALPGLLAAESAYGPTNNSIGSGAELIRMGHRVVFAAEESWAGKIEPLGIEERLVSMAPPPEEEAAAGQFWIDFIRDTSPEFRKSTFDQITTFIEPVWRSLMDGAKYANPQFAAIVDERAKHRAGQRFCLPRLEGSGPAIRPTRVLPASGDDRSRDSSCSRRPPGRGSVAVAGLAR
ncbi:MAG: hypothetical protein ACO3J3_10540, partial [Candidatus Nanopelagicales bacterium]